MDMTNDEKVTTGLFPTPEEAVDVIEHGLGTDDHLIIAFGPCKVEYDGRAASDLGVGERLIIIKPDGVVEVHADENVKPRNWQPSGSSASVQLGEDGVVHIEATRTSPDETLDIFLTTVHQVSSYHVDDAEELSLVGTEDQMQDRIMSTPDIIEEGFRAIEAEYSISVGAIDIFGRDKDGTPVIVELKRRRMGPDAVDQLRRYVETYEEETGDDVRGILVAPSLTESAKKRLSDCGLEHINLEPQTEVDAGGDAKITDYTDE